MRLKLPADHLAHVKIVNLFRPGEGDTICFPAGGFSATTAVVNGQERNLAEYFQEIKADARLPLVADYCGAKVNVSLKNVDPQHGCVEFYAPVVSGVEYKLASPVQDYVSEFEARLKEATPVNVLFSCNCILNYLYSKLEGSRTGALVGPVTFGEIAFQLLNQTLVYLEIVKIPAATAVPPASALELSAAHEELQASERRFRALCESAPMGIFLTDAAGGYLYDNPRCRKLSGLSTEAATDASAWLKRVHPNDLPGLMASRDECAREGRDYNYEYRFVGPDGQIRWVHTRTAFLRSETGTITGRIGTVEDISERKQAEIELERVNQDLIKASREAGVAEFASGVLHNVKNVLNSVNVSAGVIAHKLQNSHAASLAKAAALLREHDGDLGVFITEHPQGKLLPGYLELLAKQLALEREAVLGELRQLEQNVQHIKEIVAMQQSSSKRLGVCEKTGLVDLVEDSLRIDSAGLARHGIQLVRDFDPNLPELTVEKHKVLQVLVNLIHNAKEACQASGRPERKVVVRATCEGGVVRLAVKDNGVGISPENLIRLFEHGYTTKPDGHGFGLNSSVRIARELGGDLQAQSDGVGTGATFTLQLPLCPPPTTKPDVC